MGPQVKGLLFGIALAAAPVSAQTGLTADWGGVRTSLADAGVSLRGDITGFAMGQLAGTGDKVWDASGRYDAFADLDFGKMGLVKGLGRWVEPFAGLVEQQPGPAGEKQPA